MIYNVSPEIEEYFLEQYNKCPISVAPGHWPKLNSKEEVDRYIEILYSMEKAFDQLFNEDDENDDKDEI